MNKLDVPLKYIGIPFKENGGDFFGADCLHLAKLFAENELGVKVTQIPPDIQQAQKNNQKYLQLLEPILLSELIPGDVPFFSFPGQRWHCGVYVGYGKILHTLRPLFEHKKSASLISPILAQWRQHYIGAIRTQGKQEIVVPDAEGVVGVIIMILSTIFSIVSALTAPKPPKPNFGNDTGSPKYGFDAISNTVSNELIYPFHFGRNKYGGNVIWHKDEGDIIKRIIVLGIGQINSITDVRVNDIPIGDLPGCSYTAYLGTSGQTVDSRASAEVKGLRNIAYLAVTLQTSDKLPGGDPTVTCITEGLLMKTWNGSAWTGNTYSQNPAAAIRKLLTIPREDGGPGVDESEIDDVSFGEVYDYHKALIDNGAGGTHERHQFDFVFDVERPMVDAIDEILKPYGMYLTVGEKISLKVLKPENSVWNFNEDNIDADSFKYFPLSKNESYNQVIVKYSDPAQNDVAIDAESRDQYDQITTGVTRKGEFSFLGLSRFAEASRRAEFIKNESNVNLWFCEFDVDIDALHNTVGDVTTMTHSLPGWVNKPIRIINITEEGDYKRHVIAKEENSTIYNDAFGSVIEALDYGSPPNAYAPVSEITGLSILESTYYLHKDGTVSSDILVSWTAPSDTTKQFLKEYQIEFKKGSDAYKTIGFTSNTNFTIFGVEDEVTYYVRIKTISINDVVSNGVISSALTILGKMQEPANVTGFDIFQEGNMLRFSCDPHPDVDFAYFRIKKGSEWSTGQIVTERADLTEFMYPVGEIGQINFMAKAVDTSGNESLAAIQDTINITAPPEMNFIQNFDLWSRAFDYKLTADLAYEYRNLFNSNYVRKAMALKTATTWEEREAEGQTWEYQEANNGLLLDDTYVLTEEIFEMPLPIDLGTIFEFKVIIDADYLNVANGSLVVQISYSDDAITYTAWAAVSANVLYRAQYVKYRFKLKTTNAGYNLWFYGCTIYMNAPVTKIAWGRDIAIPIGGKTILFGAGFTYPPRASVTVVNGVVGFPVVANKTKDQFDVKVYDAVGSAIGTAEVDFDARGY